MPVHNSAILAVFGACFALPSVVSVVDDDDDDVNEVIDVGTGAIAIAISIDLGVVAVESHLQFWPRTGYAHVRRLGGVGKALDL